MTDERAGEGQPEASCGKIEGQGVTPPMGVFIASPPFLDPAGARYELYQLTPEQRRQIDILNQSWKTLGLPYFDGICYGIVMKGAQGGR